MVAFPSCILHLSYKRRTKQPLRSAEDAPAIPDMETRSRIPQPMHFLQEKGRKPAVAHELPPRIYTSFLKPWYMNKCSWKTSNERLGPFRVCKIASINSSLRELLGALPSDRVGRESSSINHSTERIVTEEGNRGESRESMMSSPIRFR